ncbi:MAG: D-serine ammonia-lyase [Clostridia bacterium]|nr:D-serine ammonia-lyase [Clostridia bacterium]
MTKEQTLNVSAFSDPVLPRLSARREVFWINPALSPDNGFCEGEGITAADVDAASDRLDRFAPLLKKLFPETAANGGLIESPLVGTERLQKALAAAGIPVKGRLMVKMDADLPVAGSVKARGGVYEVLAHTEDLAFRHGLLSGPGDDYLKLADEPARAFFAARKIQVGSTGNLGLSIGIMGAALGYKATVHMSADAKQWKKDLLRKKGAEVLEYDGDYAEAVANGRRLSDIDPDSYFVDDENSKNLFCGYAVAGRRLQAQLKKAGIPVDVDHPLFVYIPCGVGGAPGGVTYGLKSVFGSAVHCFFAEPVAAPCMLLGLASGQYNGICVQDIGLDGKTAADGLAVGRCSAVAAKWIRALLSGEATVRDDALTPDMRLLWQTERLFIEPSAAAAFAPLKALLTTGQGARYLSERLSPAAAENATHILWATGGSLMPEEERKTLL